MEMSVFSFVSPLPTCKAWHIREILLAINTKNSIFKCDYSVHLPQAPHKGAWSHLTPMATVKKKKKKEKNKCLLGHVEIRTLCTVGGVVKWCNHYGKGYGSIIWTELCSPKIYMW